MSIVVIEWVNIDQTAMGRERGGWRIGRLVEPNGEIVHKSRNFDQRWERMAASVGADVPRNIGVPSRDIGA